MNFNNLYNFKNPIRHFLNTNNLIFPIDISTFPTLEMCWTVPLTFRVKKDGDKYRTLKLPNILNFKRAYYYYSGLPYFTNVQFADFTHKRLSANLDTGDFIAGEFDNQLNEDFNKLCLYDYMLKLDIKEYYGKIYTHYLGLKAFSLEDNILSGLNNGRTSGLLMGNYLSLYFAEIMLAKISSDLDSALLSNHINCDFMYFSDDFYFFCNKNDVEKIIIQFDSVLEKYEFERNENKKELWDYESYNSYNILTRYWKATIRQWNLELLKNYKIEKENGTQIKHKLVFLNQIIYRISSLKDEKSKRTFINNFFKTKHFQEVDFSNYKVKDYDYHQLCYLLKLSPESFLYTSYIFNDMADFDNERLKTFLKLRYSESLSSPLHDEQLYYYFSIKCFGFNDILEEKTSSVLECGNQVLISYYLKDNLFYPLEKDQLKLLKDEKFWFQNYHLILYTPDLLSDLQANIEKYLIPKMALSKVAKLNRYLDFYKDNLDLEIALINDIPSVITNIQAYLSLRYKETAFDFDEEE